MHNDNRFYVLEDGTICPIPDKAPAEYLIQSMECLGKLPATIIPGSIAFLTNKKREWQKSPNGKWIEKEGGPFVAPEDFKVMPMDPTETIWGHTVSDLQSDIFVANGVIVGTLAYVSSGTLATDWGPGHFLALKFDGEAFTTAKHIWVGLNPSVSSGMVDVINDPDRNGTFKITSDEQWFEVVIDYGSYMVSYSYGLYDMKLATGT